MKLIIRIFSEAERFGRTSYGIQERVFLQLPILPTSVIIESGWLRLFLKLFLEKEIALKTLIFYDVLEIISFRRV